MASEFYALGEEFLFNSSAAGNQTGPAVAMLSNGGVVAVWTTDDETQDGSGTAVKARVLTAEGNLLEPEFLVNTDTLGNQSAPAVAKLADGGFVVVWGAPDALVKARIFSEDGTPLGDEFAVNLGLDRYGNKPVVTGLLGGGFVVAWEGADSSGWPATKARLFETDGSAAGDEIVLMPDQWDADWYPDLASLANGGFALGWKNFMSGEGWVRSFDAAGAAVGDPVQVAGTVPESDMDPAPSIAVLDNGDLAAAFETAGYSGKYGAGATQVSVRLYEASAALTTAKLDLTASGGGFFYPYSNTNPDIAGYWPDGFVVTWQNSSPGTDGDGTAIIARVFAGDGSSLSDEILVNSEVIGNQTSATVTGLLDGKFLVSWVTNDPGQDGSGSAIKARLFTSGDSAPFEFGFIDTRKERLVASLTDGAWLDPQQLVAPNYRGIVASYVGDGDAGNDDGSIVFTLRDADGLIVAASTENLLPFALFGDFGLGNYKDAEPGLDDGIYHLTATAYEEDQGGGAALASETITFRLGSKFIYSLVDTGTDAVVTDFKEGDWIDQDDSISPNNRGFMATYVHSGGELFPYFISFSLYDGEGEMVAQSDVDYRAPFTLFGESNGDFLDAVPPLDDGYYRMTVVASDPRYYETIARETVSFSLGAGAPAGPFEYAFVDTRTDRIVTEIIDGAALDTENAIAFQNRGILAAYVGDGDTDDDDGSIVFVLRDAAGEVVFESTENALPFALFGDYGLGSYKDASVPLADGNYSLEVTAYDEDGAQGQILASDILTFTLGSGVDELL